MSNSALDLLTLRWLLDFQWRCQVASWIDMWSFRRGKCIAFKIKSLDESTKGVSVVNKVDQGLSPGTFQHQEKRRNQQRRLTKNDQQGRKTKRVES